jgi:hypothetical protein
MTLLHVHGAGHVARVEQSSAHVVKVGARRAKPAHTATWARRTLTVCDNKKRGEKWDNCVFGDSNVSHRRPQDFCSVVRVAEVGGRS